MSDQSKLTDAEFAANGDYEEVGCASTRSRLTYGRRKPAHPV